MVTALAVVEEAKIVLEHIRIDSTHRVFRLVTQQIVVGRARRIAKHTVIHASVTKKQQIFRCRRGIGSTVIEHLHQAAIGCSVGCARRKLVIHLVDSDHSNRDVIIETVRLGKALGCREQLARRGDYYHHINLLHSVQILIRDNTHRFYRRKGCFCVKRHIFILRRRGSNYGICTVGVLALYAIDIIGRRDI